MSGAPAGAAASALPPENLSLVARVAGVIRHPRTTFEQIAIAPRSGPVLVLLFVVPFAVSAALFSTDVGRRALVDQWERTAIAFGQPVDDAMYLDFQRLSNRGIAYAAATSLARGPVVAVVLAGAVYGLFGGWHRRGAAYGQVLGVVAHAGLILALRDVVTAPIYYVRESIGSATSLVQLAGGFDEASPLARFLALIDLFVVWWLVVLAIGLSVLYQQTPRRIGAVLGTVYVAGALLLAGVMAVLGET